jgi:hypothetical protein
MYAPNTGCRFQCIQTRGGSIFTAVLQPEIDEAPEAAGGSVSVLKWLFRLLRLSPERTVSYMPSVKHGEAVMAVEDHRLYLKMASSIRSPQRSGETLRPGDAQDNPPLRPRAMISTLPN